MKRERERVMITEVDKSEASCLMEPKIRSKKRYKRPKINEKEAGVGPF